jgi:hypothetical protein
MSKEITVILKDDERTYRQKFLMYEDFTMNHEDPVIKICIESARKNFEGEPDDIQIRVLMVLK